MNKKHHIILRELQLWINNKNVLPVSTNNEPSLEQGGLGNRTEFIHFDTKTAVKSNSIYLIGQNNKNIPNHQYK